MSKMFHVKQPTDISDAICMKEPDLTPFTCMRGRPGLPVRSNVMEVNGRFKRVKKWIGGKPGLLDKVAREHQFWDSYNQFDWTWPKEIESPE